MQVTLVAKMINSSIQGSLACNNKLLKQSPDLTDNFPKNNFEMQKVFIKYIQFIEKKRMTSTVVCN